MGVDACRRVVLGRIAGVYGVKGWVRVESWTRPPRSLLDYPEWQLGCAGQWRRMRRLDGRMQGRKLVAQLVDEAGNVYMDRDRAAALIGHEIAVLRGQMPPAGPGEYYWADLEGLAVEDLEGSILGRVRELIETPAHDLLVVSGGRERLIPFVQGPIVKSVDLESGTIRVDWADPVE